MTKSASEVTVDALSIRYMSTLLLSQEPSIQSGGLTRVQDTFLAVMGWEAWYTTDYDRLPMCWGLTERQQFTLIFTSIAKLEAPINLTHACPWTVKGRWGTWRKPSSGTGRRAPQWGPRHPVDLNPEPSCCEAKVATLIFGHPFSFLAFQREEQQHLQMSALEGGCGAR